MTRKTISMRLLSLALALSGAVGACDRGEPRRDEGGEIALAPDRRDDRPARSSGTAGDDVVVAIGDVHGDLSAARQALRLAGAIDADGHWSGGSMKVVQTGDQIDRGDDEPEVLALFERLATEARQSGGAVHSLLGNHEVMNVQGDLRYVTPEGFVDYAEHAPSEARALPERVPPRARGRLWAFRPGGALARRLAERPAVLVLDGTVFVHAGVTPEMAELGAAAINQRVRAFLRGESPPDPQILGSEGPLWTRRYSATPDREDCAALERSLDALGAERMVMGHTVQPEGIESYCDGRAWAIDVGMAAHYGGSPEVLRIEGDRTRVLE